MMQQNTREWLEYRKTKIGASDAPIIMGVSPWMTPLQLWKEKLDLAPARVPSPWMERGIQLQEEALCRFQEKTGLIVFPEVRVHSFLPWMIASLDGITMDGSEIVEIKCPGEKTHAEAIKGIVPDYYMPQIQHQMAVCDLERCHYFSFSGVDTALVIVQRDDQYIKKLIEMETLFFSHLTSREAPIFSCRDKRVMDSDRWKKLCEEWREKSHLVRIATDEEQRVREELVSLCEDTSCEGGGLRVTKVISQKGYKDKWKITEKE